MLYPLSYGGSDADSAWDTPVCPRESPSSAVPSVGASADRRTEDHHHHLAGRMLLGSLFGAL